MNEAAHAPVGELVTADGKPQIREFLGRPTEHSHIVQFYEAEDALIENVVAFLAAGIRAGEPVIVIATPDHRAAFADGLRQQGFARLTPEHGVTMIDARETLATFMDGDLPSWDRFQTVVGGLVEANLKRSATGKLRAYGEMVDALWRDGNRQAAIRLEEHWNDLGSLYTFSLLCAYVMGNFVKSADADAFREVCKTHSHVLPAEGYSAIEDGNERLRVISELQQRAHALEHEVTHRRELEAALRESLSRETALREQAERHVHFADLFAGMLGHDLRNPLGTIAMGASYIARSNLGEKPTRTAMRIATSAERMGRMITQLLDLTRIRAAGGLVLNRSRVELTEVCERVKEEIEAGHPQCSIVLRTSGNTGGLWDRDRLLQVFSNLVGNAVTHGTAECQVSIEADGQDASSVACYVRNAGVVDSEVLPVIFDPFRGGKKRHNANGLGLGLFITRQIVLAHGGEIAVTSSPDQGTLVCVRLPRFPRGSTENQTVRV